MASTYSALKIELIATGEQVNVWGATTNTNLGTALEQAIVGRTAASFTTDGNLTIDLTNTNSTQVARHYILNLTSTGTLTATRDLIVPSIDKPYIIENNTTGGQSIRVKTTAGTGITVPNGKTAMVYANSTNVVSAVSYIPAVTIDTATIATTTIAAGTATFSAATITTATINGGTITGITDLAVADGGTGLSTLTANNVILGNGASAPTFVAPGASGNLLTSNGTTWASTTPATTVSSFSAGTTGFTPSTTTTGAVTLSGTLAVANGGSGVTTSTGTTNNVLSEGPTFTGVPAAPTAANGTNTTQLATTAFAYGTLSATTNGHTKLPNGLIQQWGTTSNIGGDSAATITYPIVFPTAVYSIQITPIRSINISGGGENSVSSITTTDFVLNRGQDGASTFYWMAIGK